ncbi:MAG: zinc ribbon domain-containing protein [Methanoregula sp.]|nr:zinc ribbon domain-containing protein [Methanoregula sp.]
MTHIVENKSRRYTWELVRHTYLVDLEDEIEIRQVEISPSRKNRLLEPPYPRARFFEIEIDQIQKNGKTVYSFRNICPVEIRQKPDLHLMNCRIKIGSSGVTRRFHSQDSEIETRWLYTDDFFLISLSSGDRHDLSTLLSLIIGKLNMIAFSIQSGRRIRSEFENQLTYRAAMSSMFSEGVDGAFRDVPVYQQHGEVTSSGPDGSAVVISAALQDFSAVNPQNAGSSTPAETSVAGNTGTGSVAAGDIPAEEPLAEVTVPEPAAGETIPDNRQLFESIPKTSTQSDSIPKESAPIEGILVIPSCSSCGAGISSTTKFCGSCGAAVSTALMVERARAAKSCSRCGAGISITTKFCGSCGATVSTTPPAERAPVSSGITAGEGDVTSPTSSRSAAGPVVNLKSIEELEDLSWLSD